jgi:hypothetical protein
MKIFLRFFYKNKNCQAAFFAIIFLVFFSGKNIEKPAEKWGFYAHKKINRMAVFTLPIEMIVFFKKHIQFISDHATAPDMRRYVDVHEGARHFIDLDFWGKPPFENVPKSWTDALILHTNWFAELENGDTVRVFSAAAEEKRGIRFDTILPLWKISDGKNLRLNSLKINRLRQFYRLEMMPNYYDEEWKISKDSLQKWFDENGLDTVCVKKAWAVEHFSKHGVVPWHLAAMQRRLTNAFVEKNVEKILKNAAEIGHYIGDAHVPLHTTSNYDGQKTGQTGIHSFWESRIPELFAENEWNFIAGKPEYLRDPSEFYWNMVFESHRLVDTVLQKETWARQNVRSDFQMTIEVRGRNASPAPSEFFARFYKESMGNMVEERFRQAIHAVSSAWYTAWEDAGRPDLNVLLNEKGAISPDSLPKNIESRQILGRPE